MSDSDDDMTELGKAMLEVKAWQLAMKMCGCGVCKGSLELAEMRLERAHARAGAKPGRTPTTKEVEAYYNK